jgi:hypothetical protein
MNKYNQIVLGVNILWVLFTVLASFVIVMAFNGDLEHWKVETWDDIAGRVFLRFYAVLFYITAASMFYWPMYLIWTHL